MKKWLIILVSMFAAIYAVPRIGVVVYTRNYIKTVYAEYVDMGSVTYEIIDVDRIEHNFKVKLNYRNDEITFNYI